MSEIKLLPCPLCGGEAHNPGYISGWYFNWEIKCQSCMASTGLKCSEEEAAAAWNRRTPDIVRCGECILKKEISINDTLGFNADVFCTLLEKYMLNNDFCSYGERRGDA